MAKVASEKETENYNNLTVNCKRYLNRTINYYVFRKLWRYLNKCVESDNTKKDLYCTLSITRNTYTKLVNPLYPIQPSARMLEKLSGTGMDTEFLTGLRIIDIKNISTDMWYDFFINKSIPSMEINKVLTATFQVIETVYLYDSDLVALKHFIETGEKLTSIKDGKQVELCTVKLMEVTYNNLLNAPQAILDKYNEALRTQLEYVNTALRHQKFSIK